MSLGRTEDPDVLPTGDFIVLDRVLLKGAADYHSYREIPANAKQGLIRMVLLQGLLEVSRLDQVRHRQMAAMANDDQAIDEYLRTVPGGMDYHRLALLARLSLA